MYKKFFSSDQSVNIPHNPAVNRWKHPTRPVYEMVNMECFERVNAGSNTVTALQKWKCTWLRIICAGLLILVLISMGLTGCSKGRQETAEKQPGKEAADGKPAGKSTQEEAGTDLLKLDKHAQELAGIKTMVIKRETIAKVVEFPAEIDFDQTRIFAISCPIDGKVVKVNCNQGDTIKPGDTLAEIENPQTIGQIFKVNASCNGFVTRRYINPALWVTRGGTLFEAVDTSKLWGIIRLYPEEAQEIKTGQEVETLVTRPIEGALRGTPDVKEVIQRVGRPEGSEMPETANIGEMYVQLADWKERNHSIDDIKDWMRKSVEGFRNDFGTTPKRLVPSLLIRLMETRCDYLPSVKSGKTQAL